MQVIKWSMECLGAGKALGDLAQGRLHQSFLGFPLKTSCALLPAPPPCPHRPFPTPTGSPQPLGLISTRPYTPLLTYLLKSFEAFPSAGVAHFNMGPCGTIPEAAAIFTATRMQFDHWKNGGCFQNNVMRLRDKATHSTLLMQSA